jgi:hypothetical protein
MSVSQMAHLAAKQPPCSCPAVYTRKGARQGAFQAVMIPVLNGILPDCGRWDKTQPAESKTLNVTVAMPTGQNHPGVRWVILSVLFTERDLCSFSP